MNVQFVSGSQFHRTAIAMMKPSLRILMNN